MTAACCPASEPLSFSSKIRHGGWAAPGPKNRRFCCSSRARHGLMHPAATMPADRTSRAWYRAPRRPEGHMTIGRRKLLGALGCAAAWPLAARAQRSGPWRIGQVRAGTPEAIGPSAGALEEQLRHLGYAEGSNIVLISRYVAPQPEAMEAAIRELLPQIDLLVAWGTLGGV